VGGAFVDIEPITTPLADRSRRINIHAALGALFILGFPLAATVTGLAAGREPSFGPVLAWASIALWLTLAWFLGVTFSYARQESEASAEVRIGWPNRVSMLVCLGDGSVLVMTRTDLPRRAAVQAGEGASCHKGGPHSPSLASIHPLDLGCNAQRHLHMIGRGFESLNPLRAYVTASARERSPGQRRPRNRRALLEGSRHA
jgi:hypothetical protein